MPPELESTIFEFCPLPFASSTPEEECERALAHLGQVILLEGPSTISALVLEPVTGSSGVVVPPTRITGRHFRNLETITALVVELVPEAAV